GCLHRILDQRAVPSAVIGPAASGVVLVTKFARELELARHRTGLGISQPPPAWQRHEQRAVFRGEGEPIAEIDLRAGAHAAVCSAFERVPELDGGSMRGAVGSLEAFDFSVGIGVAWIEFAPGADAATKTEGQVIDLAEGAAGLVIGRDRALERLR